MKAIISIANMKGGVGKTTLCVSLAEGLCYLRKHVLVLDLDAQTNCSQILWGKRTGNPWKDGANIHGYLHQITSKSRADCFPYIKRNIIQNPANAGAISLFCGSPELFLFERQKLSQFRGGITQLEAIYAKAFEIIYEREADNFDYILVDCPPGISLIAEAALRRSELIIIPTAPNFLSTMGVQAFAGFLMNNTDSERYVFINQVNAAARSMARFRREIWSELEKTFPQYKVFKNHYPQRVAIQRAMQRYDGSTFDARYEKSAYLVKNVVEELIGIIDDKQTAHRNDRAGNRSSGI